MLRTKGTELPDAPPSNGDRPESRLLEPVATVVRGTYRLIVAGLVIGAVTSLAGITPAPLWAGSSVCADSHSVYSSEGFHHMFRPHAGVEVMTRPSYCTDHADSAQRLFDFLGGFPSWLLVLGILFLLNRLIKGALREGVFTARTVKYLRVAGWWLLAGCLASKVVEAGAHAALLATLTQEHTFSADDWLADWQPPYALVFTALGILTFARIMRAGVAMREDLEGTV
jgi:DUF2975 family protein